jgi:hypothetical protein
LQARAAQAEDLRYSRLKICATPRLPQKRQISNLQHRSNPFHFATISRALYKRCSTLCGKNLRKLGKLL